MATITIELEVGETVFLAATAYPAAPAEDVPDDTPPGDDNEAEQEESEIIEGPWEARQ